MLFFAVFLVVLFELFFVLFFVVLAVLFDFFFAAPPDSERRSTFLEACSNIGGVALIEDCRAG